MRYNALDPSGNANGDWETLVGRPCLVTTINNPGKGKHAGKVFVNIASVAAMRAKDREDVPDLVNPSVRFDMDQPDLDDFDRLPQWVQDKIKGGLEFKGSRLDEILKDVSDHSKGTSGDLDDEIPF